MGDPKQARNSIKDQRLSDLRPVVADDWPMDDDDDISLTKYRMS